MAGLFEDLFTSGTNFLGAQAIQEGLADQLGNVQNNVNTIADRAVADSTFKPFSVTTSGLGNVGTDAGGNLNINLSPEQQAMQDSLLSQSGGFFDSAARNTADREQSIYDSIRATQMPEEERNRLGLENRLLSQGRLGISTDAYGGTPEQLALAKAEAEARNGASLSAIQQAQSQQAQDASLGSQFQQAGYNPQNQLLSAFAPAMGVADLASAGNREGANLAAQAGMAGMTQEANLNQLIAELEASKLGVAGGVAGSIGQGIDQAGGVGGLWDKIKGIF